MRRLLTSILIALFFLGMAGTSGLASGSQEEAKTMVENAITFLKANGKEKTIAELNNPKGKFINGEVYVVALDLNATVLAHPTSPKLVGVNTLEVPDPDGKFFRKDIQKLAKTQGSGWVDYKFKNPKTSKIESKTSFIKKVDDMILLCGIYK
jgi:cytochrome c